MSCPRRPAPARRRALPCQPADNERPDRETEDELGLQLFKRGMRAATPTVNGRAVIRQAQIVLGVDGIGARRPGPVPRKVPDPNSLGETIRISCEPKMVRRTVHSKRERIMNLRCSPRPDPDDRKFAAEPASEPELRHLKQRVLISLRLARGALIVS